MHEHKQNQCKRKVKNRKNVVGLIIFCITVGIVFLYVYYQNLRKEIDARQKWLETVLIGEKRWILENQGFCWKQMGKWESTGKRVENLFIKKRLIPKTDI